MNNKSASLEDRLNVLEKYQVFLGVIVALVMQIVWDNIKRDAYASWRIVFIFFFAFCVYSLLNVCVFYLLLYTGEKVKANKIGVENLFLVIIISMGAFLSLSVFFSEKNLLLESLLPLVLSFIIVLRYLTLFRKYFTPKQKNIGN